MPLWSPRLLEPADLVREATSLSETPFVLEYGDAPWLAISLPANEEGMMAALLAANQPGQAAPKLEFHTKMATAATLRAQIDRRSPPDREPGTAELATTIGDRRRFHPV